MILGRKKGCVLGHNKKRKVFDKIRRDGYFNEDPKRNILSM